MSEKTCKDVRLYYSVALGVMTVILGALFIWQVLEIYLSADVHAFTRDKVGAALMRILPAFCIWIVMVVGGFVIWEVFPVKAAKVAYKDPRYSLYRLKKRMPSQFEGEADAYYTIFKYEELKLKMAWLAVAALALAGIIYSIVYLATPTHFPNKDVTHEVLNMALNVFTWVAAVIIAAWCVCVYEGISAKRKIPLAKKLVVAGKPQKPVYGKFYEVIHHKYFKIGVQTCIGVIAVAFIITGIFNENMSRILEKAINICLECIGLG